MAGVPVRVLVADDQELMAARTAAALDPLGGFAVVGVAASASEAAELAASTTPDVALVGARLPGGAERAVREILSASPATPVLAYSGASDHEVLMGMLRAGARGYVVRGASAEKLASALRRAADGESVVDDVLGREVIHELLDQVREGDRVREERALKRARIRAAMEQEELEIVFQPIVNLDSRAVVGHEALARFAGNPQRGPDLWFAEAHEVGLGEELELWAVRVACERSSVLPRARSWR